MRLIDLLAGLSRLADLGFGLPPGESLRSAALAATLARSMELPDDEVRAAQYTALLLHVGCVGYAHEAARLFGDEFLTNVASERTNRADVRDVATTLIPAMVRSRPPRERVRTAATAVTRGQRVGRAFDTAACEVGRDAARRLGLEEQVQRSVYHSSEWWNGRGAPDGLAGEAIPVGARIVSVTSVAVLFDAVGGPDLAVAALRERRRGLVDPHVADHLTARADRLLGELAAVDPYELVLDAEPRPTVSVLEPGLAEVAAVFGDLADLKAPFTHGHSRGVARLARHAGQRCGLTADRLSDLELAALLHDVGRVAVSSRIWAKPGRLDAHEWEQVRLHAYHSERILAASKHLARLAPLAGMHHERCDGSGYHRGAAGDDLSIQGRILAAADAFHAMVQPRAHRAALAFDQAERELVDDARAGRLDSDAVAAVLAAAGRNVEPVRRQRPAGLTDREVEVVRLVAHGCSNREIAQRLVISRRTAEYHVQQIYRKIGSSSRASAAMFAMEHHLLDTGDQ